MSGGGKATVFVGARLFDGERIHDDRALVVADGRVSGVVALADRPLGAREIDLGGGVLSPGFVDWQVNGGGGVLFNDTPTREAIAAICAAHRREGVTALLPTVVTDAPEVLAAALEAARAAEGVVPGALGVHVEGPFIDRRRKGVHPERHIRAMRDADADALIAARKGVMVVTLAPASSSLAQIARLAGNGVVISLGHAEVTAEEAAAVFDAGATAVTHLFNAMSQFGSRAPGLVGAALADRRVICGLIADGVHAHGVAVKAAIAAKGSTGVALISDAMPPAAGGPETYVLHGERMRRVGRALLTEAGVLAGAVISMRDAVAFVAGDLALPLADALRMATATPARLLKLDHVIGRLVPGARADLVHLSDRLHVERVWVGGRDASELAGGV